MKRRYVICVDDSTSEIQDAVTNYLKDEGLGYWHWLTDLWLATDMKKESSAEKIRDDLQLIAKGFYVLVIQLDGENTWRGWGNPKMFNWFHETWDK